MRTEININPAIFTWAIARAGYELHDFILKYPKVKEWISNTKKPTIKQLEDFSKKVHLPFGYLFLPEPPEEDLPIPFFRTSSSLRSKNVSLNVFDTISILQRRQDWLREYLIDNDFDELAFVGKFKNNQNSFSIVEDIRQTLGLQYDWAKSCATWQDALELLTQAIENVGIIIIFNGVVENNTSRPISVDDCRGFVLVDDIVPFMFVNNSDSKAAQLFTIVHEVAHIWIGQSAGFDFSNLQPANDPNEILCDKIAAEFLVPESSFRQLWKGLPSINLLTRRFKVSEIVIARRALDLAYISQKEFLTFYNNFISREIKKKESQVSGGDFYATAKKRLNLTFAAHINQAVKSGKLLYRDAYKLTSLKGGTYQNFFTKYF